MSRKCGVSLLQHPDILQMFNLVPVLLPGVTFAVSTHAHLFDYLSLQVFITLNVSAAEGRILTAPWN